MTSDLSFEFSDYGASLRAFIAHPRSEDAAFDALARRLFGLQFARVAPYRALCEARGATPDRVSHWREIPAVPAAAFKEWELSSLRPEERTTVFRSSGTTARERSRHFHNADSLALYEASLLPWFKRHLLPDCDRMLIISLTPPPGLAPESSLVHMLGVVQREHGSDESCFAGAMDGTGAWIVDLASVLSACQKAIEANRPVAVLGTAFAFVYLLSYLTLTGRCCRLPPGSRAMETGGYKGRSRQLPKAELHSLIGRNLGIPASHIISEYGMSELSSQAYDHTAGAPPLQMPCAATVQPFNPFTLQPFNPSTVQRILQFPPWARVRVVSSETGEDVAEGETGLIRVYDLANLRSVMAVQTEDLGTRRGAGFEWAGRAAASEPRGCSLMSI